MGGWGVVFNDAVTGCLSHPVLSRLPLPCGGNRLPVSGGGNQKMLQATGRRHTDKQLVTATWRESPRATSKIEENIKHLLLESKKLSC